MLNPKPIDADLLPLMLTLLFDDASHRGRPTVLALGAHSDDIELGCGGTLLHLAERYPDVNVVWVVLSATPARAAEARESADEFLAGSRSRRVMVEDFRDGFFPYEGGAIKEFFEWLRSARCGRSCAASRASAHGTGSPRICSWR